jgi:photosystem II stability/assembly factor-like uncharacterized protein
MKKFKVILLLSFFVLANCVLQAQWVQTAGPSGVSTFASNGSSLFAGGGTIGVYTSTDQGITWVSINSNLQDTSMSCLAVSGSNLYAGTPSGIYRSTNNGTNWETASTGIPGYVQDIVVSTTNLFAGTLFGVYLSTDNGTSWSAKNNGLTETFVLDLVVNGINLFAATQNGVFLSTDNGANWTSAGLDNLNVSQIEISNNNLFAVTIQDGVYVSTDNGTLWNISNSDLTDLNINDFEVYEANVFLATAFTGVFLTTNNGISWVPVDSGLTTFYVSALGVDETYLFAGTMTSGVWRRPLSEMITDVYDVQYLPIEFILSQNYPNPFNPSTKISWQVPVGSGQTLKIYDVLGNKVATLVDEYKPAGKYEVEFNSSSGIRDLASGIYFYQLNAGEFVSTKKMILLK